MGRAGARSASALPLLLLLVLLRAERPRGAELTFELPDSARQCFHEDVERGARFSLDYQVGRASPAGRQRRRSRARPTPLGPRRPGCTPMSAGGTGLRAPSPPLCALGAAG